MPWNSTSPSGTISVKANRTPMNQNTSYIETTMGNSVVGTNAVTTRDHFWNVGSNEDGRHRFMQSPGFTVGGNPTDPVIGTGMDGVLYLKSDGLSSSRVQGYYRNASGIYQYIPSFLSGTVVINSTSTFVTVAAVPQSVYGEIFIWLDGTRNIQQAVFMSSTTRVEAYSLREKQFGVSDDYFVEFLNDSGATDLNIKARRGNDASGTYNYRITYRAI